MGSLRRDGDSWFIGRRNASITQEVSARGPERIYFMCAIHPWMHGIDQGPALGGSRFDGPNARPPEPLPRFGRRAFLGALGGGALALLLPLRLRPGSLLPVSEQTSVAAAATPFRRRLPIPRVLRGRTCGSRSARPRCRSCPGRKTRMWTYGGHLPGPDDPAPRRRSRPRSPSTTGCRAKAGELTVHLHGGHNRSADSTGSRAG